MSYKTEILVIGEQTWTSNGLRFATEKEAMDAGHELSGRWFMVKEWRATKSEDPVNYSFDPKTDPRPIKIE